MWCSFLLQVFLFLVRVVYTCALKTFFAFLSKCSGKNMHHTRWWGNLWLLEAFPSWHRAQIMKHARTEYPSPSYWGAEKLDVSLIYIFLCGSPIGGALSASTRIKHMVFSSISAFWLLRRLLHTFYYIQKGLSECIYFGCELFHNL